MLLPRFAFDEPETVGEASALLREHGEAAAFYAGGTELLLAMKLRILRYARLVSLKRIRGLDAIRGEGGALVLGALATHHAIETSPLVRERVPVLAEVARQVANVRVRMAGTLGGNLCFAEPHADPPTILAALGARVRLADAAGTREVPAADFFVGAYETARRWDELLTAVVVPLPAPGTRVRYRRLAFVERPAVAVAAALVLDAGRRVREARLVVGAVATRPQRAAAAEAELAGRDVGGLGGVLPAVARLAAMSVEVDADAHGSEEYKRHLVEVEVRRALRDLAA
jgi:carbon-monoxide dehydrogenase medium subunit